MIFAKCSPPSPPFIWLGKQIRVPARDHGIDLTAYLDLDSSFVACPIQMKAALGRAFSISRKYGKFPNLIHAYVWNVAKETEIYALNEREAVAIADHMGYTGYTKTQSWLAGGRPRLWHDKIGAALTVAASDAP
ncbi:MAG TPA: hypothetical protein VN380_14910 [Thermoanaerobaculia bacterium]|nr:hypothetical protein [Thermoanaerobaculia bacterium]